MKFFKTFQLQIVDYRARDGAGAEAAILNSWSRAKMEWLHNTGVLDLGPFVRIRIELFSWVQMKIGQNLNPIRIPEKNAQVQV